ncbi:hypothetical protein IWQ49_003908 [Labrenzia sp. EL_126]|nr:hypothetical protein [Labrenzia sp. EL_126]
MDREKENPSGCDAGAGNSAECACAQISDGTLLGFAARQSEICHFVAEKSTAGSCYLNETQLVSNARRIKAKLEVFKPSKAFECIRLPSQARLLELFDYDETTGNLRFRKSRGGKRAGSLCGTLCYGYIQVSIDERVYRAHRVIFKMAFGREPIGYVDHIDGNRSNNRLENLREATPWQNSLNRVAPSTSNTGHMGVYWNKDARRFNVCISIGNQNVNLGYFEKLCCAVAARKHAFDIVVGAPSNDNARVA